jgi:processive 1,2-diacylglycerol beta-glucosyltransferase
MPLLRMPSGHHQVAEALIAMLEKQHNDVDIKKIDVISYTSNFLEKIVSDVYLKWINNVPGSYHWVYKNFINAKSDESSLLKLYKRLFLKKMEQLLADEEPDLIICTHGLPSFLLNELKVKGKTDIPVINVYTDFFMNDMWGKTAIDVHFVPNQQIKSVLLNEFNVREQNIHVTGIPIHEEFLRKTQAKRSQGRKKILISGGNIGLGDIVSLLQEVKDSKGFDYLVLCGKNQKLYNQITAWGLSHITPISYVTSRSAMNLLYDQADAIITKPGGVTISEVIQKKLPIFIHSALPGQEEVNLHFLKSKGLVFPLNRKLPIESQLFQIIMDKQKLSRFNKQMEAYHKEMVVKEQDIIDLIESLLDIDSYKSINPAINNSLYAY